MKTFQERLECDDDLMDPKVFSAMVEAGLDPNWTFGSEFDNWFKTLSQDDPETFQHIVKLVVASIPYSAA